MKKKWKENEEYLKKWLLNSILKLKIWKIMVHVLIREVRGLKEARLCILGTSSFHIPKLQEGERAVCR